MYNVLSTGHFVRRHFMQGTGYSWHFAWYGIKPILAVKHKMQYYITRKIANIFLTHFRVFVLLSWKNSQKSKLCFLSYWEMQRWCVFNCVTFLAERPSSRFTDLRKLMEPNYLGEDRNKKIYDCFCLILLSRLSQTFEQVYFLLNWARKTSV